MSIAAEQADICYRNAVFMEQCAANPKANKQYCIGMVETYLRMAAQWEARKHAQHGGN